MSADGRWIRPASTRRPVLTSAGVRPPGAAGPGRDREAADPPGGPAASSRPRADAGGGRRSRRSGYPGPGSSRTCCRCWPCCSPRARSRSTCSAATPPSLTRAPTSTRATRRSPTSRTAPRWRRTRPSSPARR
ncbi:hypothetical protein ACFQ0M_29995 [Kitasatospora aburaviensis]